MWSEEGQMAKSEFVWNADDAAALIITSAKM